MLADEVALAEKIYSIIERSSHRISGNELAIDIARAIQPLTDSRRDALRRLLNSWMNNETTIVQASNGVHAWHLRGVAMCLMDELQLDN